MHNVSKFNFIVLRFLVGRPGDFRHNVCIFNISDNDLGRSPVTHFKYTVSRPTVATAVFINIYPTAFPYGNGMVLHFYQQQESSTTKTVHKVINKGLKTYV